MVILNDATMRCTLIVRCMRVSPGTGNVQLGHPPKKETLHYSQPHDAMFISYIHCAFNAIIVSKLTMLRLDH
jgi:hypothetical protein